MYYVYVLTNWFSMAWFKCASAWERREASVFVVLLIRRSNNNRLIDISHDDDSIMAMKYIYILER